jgi:hypothetical protein
MNMQELPDNELDKLFRKSAEEFEPEFNPQAWSAMRKKLDDEDGKLGGIVWWKAGVLALLLLGIGMGGYHLWPTQKANNANKTFINNSVENKKNSSLAEQASAKSKLKETVLKPTQKGQEVTQKPTAKEQVSINHKKESVTPFEIDNQNILIAKSNELIVSKNQKTKTATERNLAKTNKKNSAKRLQVSQETIANQYVTNTNPLKANATVKNKSDLADASTLVSEEFTTESLRSEFSNLNELPIHGWQLLKLPLPLPLVAYTAPPPPPVVFPKEESGTVFQKGLSTRIMVAPDLSFITTNQMMQNPTLALSVMLEYRFSKRLSAQVGAVRSIKLYTATGEQYQWPEAWNSQKARPTEIWANCKVLDIPLNLRYDLSQGIKSRWFIASGVSSYMMLNEKYDYTYPPHSYPKWKNWEGSTGNYWFGVMNLSVGFERQIGRNLSIQAEPYFKLPLAQVGLGKIKLNTSGIFLSARYKLGRF